MTDAVRPRAFRRRVLFLPGFDPAPARTHRERYRREAARQAEVSGHRIAVSGQGPTSWRVDAEIGGRSATAEIEVLTWSDIVREQMRGRGVLSDHLALVRTAWIYLSTGALYRLAALRKGPVIAALYPVAVLLVELAVACGLAAAAAGLLIAPFGTEVPVIVTLAAATGALAVFVAVLRIAARKDPFLAHYLMQDYAYAAAARGAYPDALDRRITRFADRIATAMAGDADEVLVVGHSSGAYLAVSAVAEAIETGLPDGRARPALGLLTLGQVVPMVSFLPQAARLRDDLARLSVEDRLAWVDVTAPGDGCCFALCDPVAVSGAAGAGARWPLVISAAFRNTLSEARFSRLRWRFRAAHFQYLCAFDRPGDYDYFTITAGPETLATRFANRAPSPSVVSGAPRPLRQAAL